MKKNPHRKLTKYIGVYERISEERTHNGKPDVCFDIAYKADNKKIWEKAGWLSEGYSAKLASEIRAERLRSLRHGQELPKQKKKAPFFKDVAERYLEWTKANKTRAGKDDISRYNCQLRGRFDGRRLNEITPFDLERMKADLLKRSLSPGSVKHGLVLFRQMVNKALVWGMYKGENPIKGVKMPILQNQRERFLSHEEAGLLLSELKKTSPQLHDIALLALHCGLRAGEIFNLKTQDLDFGNGLITISDPKNKESRKAFM
ncbi:tyrosine-type recombinase/integrase, partial [bacterium]|nr:tyrosine-type recombinase/integrase [bacterium]